MIDTWMAVGWILFSLWCGWQAHIILPPWWAERQARKHRCETLDAYWSHEITVQETIERLASPEAKR